MDRANRWIMAATIALVCATGVFVVYSMFVSTHIERSANMSGTTSKSPPPRERLSDPSPAPGNTTPNENTSVPPAGPATR